MASRSLHARAAAFGLRLRASRSLRRAWRALSTPENAGPHDFDETRELWPSRPLLLVTYWSSHVGQAHRTLIHGRTSSLSEALRACEHDHGESLDWQEVETMHWSARAGGTVYTVRYEA